MLELFPRFFGSTIEEAPWAGTIDNTWWDNAFLWMEQSRRILLRVPGFEFFAVIGRHAVRFLEHLGKYFTLLWWVIRHLYFLRAYARDVFRQMFAIGNSSIPIVMFTSAFLGMVTSVQSAHQLYDWIPRSVVGQLVIKSVLLELVPLLTALVLAGKVGATITAELGSMRVTEQIDALETLAFDSISFLITPRVLAGTTMFPVLIVIGDFVAILGGLLGAVAVSHISPEAFISGMRASFLVSRRIVWNPESGLFRIRDHFDCLLQGLLCGRGRRRGR